MPVEHVSVKLKLNSAQLNKIKNAIAQDSPVTIKLSASAVDGLDRLSVTKTIQKRLEKAKAGNKGTTITLSRALLKANRRELSQSLSLNQKAESNLKFYLDNRNKGGSVALALEAFNVAKQAVDASPGAQKLRDRLAYLKKIQSGQGVEVPTKADGELLGQLVASGDKEAIKIHKNLEKLQSGGSLGAGWDEFWEGFKFGFTNPIEALELAGREIKNAIDKPKKLTAAQAQANSNFLKLAQEAPKNAMAAARKTGSGLTFY